MTTVQANNQATPCCKNLHYALLEMQYKFTDFELTFKELFQYYLESEMSELDEPYRRAQIFNQLESLKDVLRTVLV